jgi:hypothetical protein
MVAWPGRRLSPPPSSPAVLVGVFPSLVMTLLSAIGALPPIGSGGLTDNRVLECVRKLTGEGCKHAIA